MPAGKFERACVIVFALILGFYSLTLFVSTIWPRFVRDNSGSTLCWTDHVQNYSMARAVLLGLNPYLPVGDLFSQIEPSAPCEEPVLLPQPSPYPPASVLLYLPFVSIAGSLDRSIVLWSSFSLVLLFVALWRFLGFVQLRWVRRVVLSLGVFVALLGARALSQDIWLANMQAFLLAIVFEMLSAFQKGKNRQGGTLLGVLLAIKFTGLPLLLLLLYRRSFQVVFYALGCALFLTAIAAVLCGTEHVAAYPLAVTATLELFGHQSTNFSLLLVGHRLFGALTAAPDPYDMFQVTQLVPLLFPISDLLACDWIGRVAVAIFACLLVSRSGALVVNSAIMMAFAALTQPVAWYYTQSLALPAVLLLIARLYQNSYPAWQRILSWAAVFFLAVPPSRLVLEGGAMQLTPYQASTVLFFDSITILFVILMLAMACHPRSDSFPSHQGA